MSFYDEQPPSSEYVTESTYSEMLDAWEDQKAAQREAMLAAAVKVAIFHDDIPLALALLEAELIDLAVVQDRWQVHLVAPAGAVSTLNEASENMADWEPSRMYRVFSQVVPPARALWEIVIRVKPEALSDDWRQQLRASLEGSATNQGLPIGTSPIYTHNGFNYRSKSEISVAQELDKRNILFLPNCRASRAPVSREADFLVFHRGKVAVLEVDGPTHAGRAAEDHKRDFFFEEQGIHVHHFVAEEAYNSPQVVVAKFLQLMVASGR